MKIENILKKIAGVPAVSGFEKELGISDSICSFFTGYDTLVDEIGNVIVKISSGKRKILIEAHLDEVGFLKTIGGFVKIGDIEDRYIKKSFIETSKTVPRVSYFKRKFTSNGNLVKGPALDNKSGCSALILIKDILKNTSADIYLVFSVQEETTKSGIKSAVEKLNPDTIISIDSAYAKPFTQKRWEIPICGRGPAIQIHGCGFVIKNVDKIEKIAKREKIPYQFEIVDSDVGVTNLTGLDFKGNKFQINVPVRYQHTYFCETDIRDIENTAKLVSRLVEELACEENIKGGGQ